MFFRQSKLHLFFITILIMVLGIFINLLNLHVANLTEEEKCPACFGISMCEDIHNKNINFDFSSFYASFNNLLNVKNVYYGTYKNKKVVMKKLASNSELEAFDKMTCEYTATESWPNVNFNALIKSELSNDNITDPNVKLQLCPTVQKINKLFENVKEHSIAKDNYLQYIWTTLKINPEPIVLQILNAKDSWPTPNYFGACGRLIIQEYIGPPLSAFATKSWIKKAKIASSLLDAANLFTFKDENFAFYLTDISMDNIAVNEKDEAIFIDLENIIVVDKNPPMRVLSQFNSWNDIYTNDIDSDCQNCLVFSTSDICEHKISDHNYYAICQHILMHDLNTEMHNQGFLHNPPEHILKKYPMLQHLLKQCSKPSEPYSRIDTGMKLKKLLDTIVKDVKMMNSAIIH